MEGMGHGSQEGRFSLIVTASKVSYFFVAVSYANEKAGSGVFLLQGFQHTRSHITKCVIGCFVLCQESSNQQNGAIASAGKGRSLISGVLPVVS